MWRSALFRAKVKAGKAVDAYLQARAGTRPFEELVMRMLSKKPHLRGRDAFEIYDQLSAMLVDEGILAAGPLFLAKPEHDSGSGGRMFGTLTFSRPVPSVVPVVVAMVTPSRATLMVSAEPAGKPASATAPVLKSTLTAGTTAAAAA